MLSNRKRKLHYCVAMVVVMPLAATGSWGKTHFIIGHDGVTAPERHLVKPEPVQLSQTPFDLVRDGQVKAAFFSPCDNLCAVLEYLIEQEKKRIRVAMFTFTNKKIATALIKARQKGVVVEVIIDASCLYNKYTKIDLLHTANVALCIYNAQRAKRSQPGIMHNKFVLFDENIMHGPVLWTGSFNFTGNANDCNEENVVVLSDAALIKKFDERFNRLKKSCDHYTPPVAISAEKGKIVKK